MADQLSTAASVWVFLLSDPVSPWPSESFGASFHFLLSSPFVFSEELKYWNKVFRLSKSTESAILREAHGMYTREFLRVWVITAQQ